MYTYAKLNNIDMNTLHRIFSEAFLDYQVNINLSREEFQIMLNRRGYAPDASIGAFKEPGHELVGFILNGLRNWYGKSTAYDLGTGVIPAYRKQGISGQMFNSLLSILMQNNVEQYLLEVIQENMAAFELYKKQGLSITRSFSVFELDKSVFIPKAPAYDIEYVTGFEQGEWELLTSFFEFNPSWQNSVDSINAVPEAFAYTAVRLDSKIIGFGLVDKKTGDIPLIAVHKNYRRKGIARSIIGALSESTQAGIMHIINIDDNYEEMKLFLQAIGFKPVCCQYEMIQTLTL